MLILKDIKKKYDSSKKYVLKNINLVFKESGLVCILGESGSGKTTLLNIIGGLDKPSSGTVYIDRQQITDLAKDKSLYTKYIGFIFQNYNLISYLTTKENINLISSLNINNILKKLSISKLENKVTNNLSGGEKQRVAIARALVKDKRIILCDEPTGALDSDNSDKIMQLLKKISKDHLVIVVTHNKELVEKYASRIIRIKDGQIEDDTEPLDITERKSTHKAIKNHYSIGAIINYVSRNIMIRKRKSIFSIISYVIGLISLLLVLSISMGFNQAIEYEEKQSLAEYPIYISEYSSDLTEEIKGENQKSNSEFNYVYSKDVIHRNSIDKDLITYLDESANTRFIIKKYLINNITLSVYDKNIFEETDIIYGNYPSLGNEILLIVDDNNIIDKHLLEGINLLDDKYKIDELVDYQFKINNRYYNITGIAKFKESSILYNESGLFLNNHYDLNTLPYEIYLFPYDYQNKSSLLKYLDAYPNLQYQDNATLIKDVSTTIIDSITIILIIFSLITLIVSCLMTYILTLISITERTKEIGIFKVNGIDTPIIKFMFYLENYILSIIALLISIVVVASLSIPINNLLANLTGLDNIILIDISIIIKVLYITLMLTFVSTYFPTRRINKMNIIDNLMHN